MNYHNILKSKLLLLSITLISFLIFIFILDFIFPLPYQKPYSKVILAKDGTLLTGYLTSDQKWRMRTQIDEVSPDLIKAILEKEDKWFYWHHGVNPVAVFRAVISNIFKGRRVSGASTITMQVARLLEPAHRTYINKFREMLRAVQLEVHYSKKEILEIYLSLLPYGGNIEGVKSAAYIYFNCPPGKLSLAQSITLTVIPNNPGLLRIDRRNEQVINARNKWINKFKNNGIFPLKDLTDALNEPLPPIRNAIPVLAPHFCYYMNSLFFEDIVKTNLDMKIQSITENLLKNHVSRVKSRGVSNGSVIVIDNRTMGVIAYCGSADFYDSNSDGQVDGVRAIRSPGSTLKPGLYAASFDKGILTPRMKLLDIPMDASGYLPENYNLKFNGDVTAEFALRNSLNIPAIRLLEEYGMSQYLDILTKGGFEKVAQDRKKLGLSMILGGCGVRLEELTRFFSTFANKGHLYPLNYNLNMNDRKGNAIFSEASSFIIAQILSSNERPDFPKDMLDETELPKIAWKTGTSYGKRDAWAIGFNPRYTVGVWMGNFDGKGSPQLSGAEMAVPLLFDIFNAIDNNDNKKWFVQPQSIGIRMVCSETGMLPSNQCASLIPDYFIDKVSPNKTCYLYKEIFINEDETIQYCTECLPTEGYKKLFYPIYEPELTLWYINNNISFKKPPPHNPVCQAQFSSKGPKIISPSENFEYLLEKGAGQEILLQAASDGTVKNHTWYIDDKFFKKCKPGEKIFFRPEKEKIKIICSDDLGRESSILIKVVFY